MAAPPSGRWPHIARAAAAMLVLLCRNAPAAEPIRIATEAAIAADAPTGLTVFRFAPNPAVLVLDFATLAAQGRMLDRLAALAEKQGLPHDALLDDARLAAAIAASGDTPATWYYGHDYAAADVARFFRLADRDQVTLNADEQRLRRLVAQADAAPDGFGALISLAGIEPFYRLDQAGRTAILHHELSHGDYFTQPRYARYTQAFWRRTLDTSERAAVRAFLARAGYDPAIDDLMINEMQAYLVFTPDPHWFEPRRLAIPPARIAALRRQFAAGLLADPDRDVQPRGLQADVARLARTP